MLKPKLTLLVIIITYSRDQPLMKITFFAVLATETCVMWSSFRAACVAWSRCVAFRDLRSSSWPCAGSTRIWRREWLVSVGWSGFDMQWRWLTETLYHFSPPPSFSCRRTGPLLVCSTRWIAGGAIPCPCGWRWQGKSWMRRGDVPSEARSARQCRAEQYNW